MDKFTGRPAKDESRNDVETNTYDFLEKLNIPYETLCHEAIYTIAESEDVERYWEFHTARICFFATSSILYFAY